MLKIQTYLREHGLDKAVEEFKLKVRDYAHKVLLKYNQIESDMKIPEVQECRGIVLRKGSWDVLSMSFFKFFNSAEVLAARIDWNSARVLEKCDGSMIHVYYDEVVGKWFAGTTGTAEGEAEVNNKENTSFNNLFWDTVEQKYPAFSMDNLIKKNTYVFELTTPYNIVVKPHGISSVTLLTIRDNTNLQECSWSDLELEAERLGLPLVKSFDLNVVCCEDLLHTFDDMPWSEEGYVVVDGNHNRIKLKNPAYVAVHYLKDKTSAYHIMTIVKSNEIEEFAATFPDRKDELYKLKENYDLLIQDLEHLWSELEAVKSKDESPCERKSFALALQSKLKDSRFKMFAGLFYGLNLGKVTNVADYIHEYDDKILYEIL